MDFCSAELLIESDDGAVYDAAEFSAMNPGYKVTNDSGDSGSLTCEPLQEKSIRCYDIDSSNQALASCYDTTLIVYVVVHRA